MLIRIVEKKDCTGCHACYNICPTRAIDMVRDEEGFMYPELDEKICVNCGKCEKVCPILNPCKAEICSDIPTAFAAQTKDEHIRRNSSSGGIFTELATWILRQGGVVFGAAFNTDFSVSHVCIETEEALDKLRGSKYVQSVIGAVYEDAKKQLQAGKPVLFTGTPCQIVGLYHYLDKTYNNLYTQDIICHGVPSPLVWQAYIGFREDTAAAKISQAFFRYKKYGWKTYCVRFEFSNHTHCTQRNSDDLYIRSFLHNLCLRPSCHQCAFKTLNRVSDVTLADCWGSDKVCRELDDDQGTSLVILHSDKGRALFESIKSNVVYQEVDIHEAVKYNLAMINSVPENSERDAFMKCVREVGFKCAAKRYLRLPISSRVKRIVKAIMRK